MSDQEKELLKKAAILFFSLLLFAGITVPVYFLMLAGAKDAKDEKAEAAPVKKGKPKPKKPYYTKVKPAKEAAEDWEEGEAEEIRATLADGRLAFDLDTSTLAFGTPFFEIVCE